MKKNKRFVKTKEFGMGSLQGKFYASFEDLKKILGAPRKGDGYKVSTEWSIIDTHTGEIWSLYDYKETSLYDKSLPSIKEFRSHPYDWHIGGQSPNFSDLTKWLRSEIEIINIKR
jgi:hypothetical protein